MSIEIVTPHTLNQFREAIQQKRFPAAPGTGVFERVTRGARVKHLRSSTGRPTFSQISSHDVRTVLIIQPFAIGDYIVTTTLIDWLHQAIPQADIDVITSPVTVGLATVDSRLHRVTDVDIHGPFNTIATDVRAFVADRTYDLVYAPSVYGMTTSMRMARLVPGTPILVGSEQQRRNDVYQRFFDHLIPHYYPLSHWCESFSVAGPLAIEHEMPIEALPRLDGTDGVQSSESTGHVILNVSGKEAKKSLNSTRAVEIARSVASTMENLVVEVIGAPSDSQRLHQIVEAVGDTRVVAWEGDLVQVAHRIQTAHAVISPDTSIVHMASAGMTPVVALYPEARTIVEWGPFQVPFRALVSPDPTSVSSIPADAVIKAFVDLLSEVEVDS